MWKITTKTINLLEFFYCNTVWWKSNILIFFSLILFNISIISIGMTFLRAIYLVITRQTNKFTCNQIGWTWLEWVNPCSSLGCQGLVSLMRSAHCSLTEKIICKTTQLKSHRLVRLRNLLFWKFLFLVVSFRYKFAFSLFHILIEVVNWSCCLLVVQTWTR